MQEQESARIIEFEEKYSGKALLEGMGMKLDFLPWDIREPQPMLVALEEAGGFGAKVLDAGCGLGENAAYLASRGHSVTAFDSSTSAIELAAERARARGADVTFTVAEVTGLDVLEPGFDTVLDWGTLHSLPEQVRRPYVAGLHRLAKPGGVWQLFCFTESTAASLPMKWLRISHESLRATLDGLWHIASIEDSTSTTTLTHDIVERQRQAAGVPDAAFDHGDLDVDQRGRILMPISHLRLERV
jgi:SAM-dependent methyltransferase